MSTPTPPGLPRTKATRISSFPADCPAGTLGIVAESATATNVHGTVTCEWDDGTTTVLGIQYGVELRVQPKRITAAFGPAAIACLTAG